MKLCYTLFIIATLSSCTKHAGDYPGEIPTATLLIKSPGNNQLINKADSIRITATAIASAIMHGYDVYLTRQSDTTRLQSVSNHEHNDTLNIDTRFPPVLTGNYEAHIIVKLDHDGHTLHKSVFFKTE